MGAFRFGTNIWFLSLCIINSLSSSLSPSLSPSLSLSSSFQATRRTGGKGRASQSLRILVSRSHPRSILVALLRQLSSPTSH